MKLSQLVELTLCEIATGIDAAKEKTRSLDLMVIAPNKIDDEQVSEITYIEFDLSVVVEETDAHTSQKDKAMGGELRVLSVGMNGKITKNEGENQSSSSKASHRISFKVPVVMSARYVSHQRK